MNDGTTQTLQEFAAKNPLREILKSDSPSLVARDEVATPPSPTEVASARDDAADALAYAIQGVKAFAVHGPLAGIVLQYPPEVMEHDLGLVLDQANSVQRDWNCPVMVLPATAGAAFAGMVRETTVAELEALKPVADERLAAVELENRNRAKERQSEFFRRQKLIKRSRKLTRKLGLRSAG